MKVGYKLPLRNVTTLFSVLHCLNLFEGTFSGKSHLWLINSTEQEQSCATCRQTGKEGQRIKEVIGCTDCNLYWSVIGAKDRLQITEFTGIMLDWNYVKTCPRGCSELNPDFSHTPSFLWMQTSSSSLPTQSWQYSSEINVVPEEGRQRKEFDALDALTASCMRTHTAERACARHSVGLRNAFLVEMVKTERAFHSFTPAQQHFLLAYISTFRHIHYGDLHQSNVGDKFLLQANQSWNCLFKPGYSQRILSYHSWNCKSFLWRVFQKTSWAKRREVDTVLCMNVRWLVCASECNINFTVI